jgi:hypothetical protein
MLEKIHILVWFLPRNETKLMLTMKVCHTLSGSTVDLVDEHLVID